MDDLTDTAGSRLTQNPHRTGARKERNLELAIGREVHNMRKRQRMTVSDLSAATGISAGMLSKIERGVISPSLTSLQTLAKALRVPVVFLFSGYEEERGVMHVKAGQGVEIEREGTRAGHQYNLLGHIGSNGSGVVVEPYLITLTEESDIFPSFQHEGIEMIYMLEGIVEYRHGDRLFRLEPGDNLFFDADAPHGPEVYHQMPIRYLSVICYPQSATR